MKRTHEMVEKALVEELLTGGFNPGGPLQSERELATRFAVSRATVREALLKLQQSGWISVRQRHSTVVNDFWSRGNLEILASITRNSDPFPDQLALDLFDLRARFAPDYARRAVQNDAGRLVEFLATAARLRNTPNTLAKYDGELHLTMAVLSGNKIYPLIMNSFKELYAKVKGEFFASEECRLQARAYYRELLESATAGNADRAEEVTRAAMLQRIEYIRRKLTPVQRAS